MGAGGGELHGEGHGFPTGGRETCAGQRKGDARACAPLGRCGLPHAAPPEPGVGRPPAGAQERFAELT